METFPDPSTPGQQSEGRYLQSLLRALQQMRGGDFFVRMPGDSVGIEGKIADTFNEIVSANAGRNRQFINSPPGGRVATALIQGRGIRFRYCCRRDRAPNVIVDVVVGPEPRRAVVGAPASIDRTYPQALSAS